MVVVVVVIICPSFIVDAIPIRDQYPSPCTGTYFFENNNSNEVKGCIEGIPDGFGSKANNDNGIIFLCCFLS